MGAKISEVSCAQIGENGGICIKLNKVVCWTW